NKADLPYADITCMEIEKLLDLTCKNASWRPLVVPTVATRGEGLRELWEAADEHLEYLSKENRLAQHRKERIRGEIEDLVLSRLKDDFWSRWYNDTEVFELVDKVYSRKIDLYGARDRIVERIREEMQRLS
ncbi:MAG: hypothetical protein JRF71_06240, partial [Deltaproteobacteria bacterium]|nr:hypothetical protein [Deltaproteobacteria bacterium]